MAIPSWLAASDSVAYQHHRDATPGVTGAWPAWVSPRVRHAFARHGILAPWAHQITAAEAAHAGHHVALATGTASGKSLAYLLPVLAATADGKEPLVVAKADLDAWLKTLNGVRLSLAVRLGIESEDDHADLEKLPARDPRTQLVALYDWLGLVLESLLDAAHS